MSPHASNGLAGAPNDPGQAVQDPTPEAEFVVVSMSPKPSPRTQYAAADPDGDLCPAAACEDSAGALANLRTVSNNATAQNGDGAAAAGPLDASKVTIVVEQDDYSRSTSLKIVTYFRKWRGGLDTALTRPPPWELFMSWLGAFLGILLVAGLNEALTPAVNLPLLVASFGASAVLIFGVVESKMAQPRNFIGGQLVSAIAGCSVRAAFPGAVWVSTALGMSVALLMMQLTSTTHPPGGATALIASSAAHLGPWHGFQFVLTVFFGCLGMLVVALVVNNLSPKRRYPTFWW